jgi:FKBP-type peptidyl-prolyl cis-trans isomerase SlyD
MTENVKKNDFVELKYTGYANGEIFDSNIKEDVTKINPDFKLKQVVICVGQGMIVSGLDKELEGKEIGKEYEIDVSVKDGFGERKRELFRTIPLSSFREKKFDPKPGMVLTLDSYMVKIIAVSGARVVTDFNNPLAGKELHYKFTISRKVEDDSEKAKALFEVLWKFIPEFSISGEKVIVKGPKGLEIFAKEFDKKFKDLLGKELIFEEKKENLEKKVEEKQKEE